MESEEKKKGKVHVKRVLVQQQSHLVDMVVVAQGLFSDYNHTITLLIIGIVTCSNTLDQFYFILITIMFDSVNISFKCAVEVLQFLYILTTKRRSLLNKSPFLPLGSIPKALKLMQISFVAGSRRSFSESSKFLRKFFF